MLIDQLTFFVFNCIFRVRLTKRRPKPGEPATSNTRLVLRHRVLTAREHRMFRQRERQLEPPGQDEEEDMEDEEEDEEEEEDREQQTTTTTTKKEDAGEREDEEEKQGSEKHSDSDSQSDRSRSRYVKQLTLALNGMEFPFFLKKKKSVGVVFLK